MSFTTEVEKFGNRLGFLIRLVAFLAIFSLITEYGFYVSPETGPRSLTEETIRNAFLIVVLYSAAVIGSTLVLAVAETGPLKAVLFEELSAMGTVELFLGVAPLTCCQLENVLSL